MRALQRRARARQLGKFLAAKKEIVGRRNRGLNHVFLGSQRSEVEELRRIEGRGRPQRDGRQHEHGEGAAPRPDRVVYLPEGRDVIRIEPRGALQCLPQRDLRQRVRRWRHGSLQNEQQRQHQSPSAATGWRRRSTKRKSRRNRFPSQATTNGSVMYATGTTNSVSAVEKNTPPTIA